MPQHRKVYIIATRVEQRLVIECAVSVMFLSVYIRLLLRLIPCVQIQINWFPVRLCDIILFSKYMYTIYMCILCFCQLGCSLRSIIME